MKPLYCRFFVRKCLTIILNVIVCGEGFMFSLLTFTFYDVTYMWKCESDSCMLLLTKNYQNKEHLGGKNLTGFLFVSINMLI